MFVLYDERAKSGDTDDATVMLTASTEIEARKEATYKRDCNGIWYEYDDENGTLVNEVRRDDL